MVLFNDENGMSITRSCVSYLIMSSSIRASKMRSPRLSPAPIRAEAHHLPCAVGRIVKSQGLITAVASVEPQRTLRLRLEQNAGTILFRTPEGVVPRLRRIHPYCLFIRCGGLHLPLVAKHPAQSVWRGLTPGAGCFAATRIKLGNRRLNESTGAVGRPRTGQAWVHATVWVEPHHTLLRELIDY